MVVAQYLKEENVSIDSDTNVVFSGAQTVLFQNQEGPEIIQDSGSTATLAKNKNLLEDIKGCKVTMRSNGDDRRIQEQGI